jgi:adenine-specific DNA glycosylase
MHLIPAYIADAVLLYAFKERVFPLDGTVQRVLYRVMRGEHPPKRTDAYRDEAMERMVEVLTESLDALQLCHIHQGILLVAWEVCRARPICQACALRALCLSTRRGQVS